MSVLLIRHAHAGSRREWPDDDRLRPLSGRGHRQAKRLVNLLVPWSPQRILSSPYTRCVETVTPLACSLGLPVAATDDLAEGAAHQALALMRSVAGEKVALCTHGDVVPEILVALADEDLLDLGPNPRQAKGSTWVLESNGGRFVKATYLPPAG